MTRPHGYARYKLDGCRCNVCGFAVSEYTRLRRRAILTGTWRVDAAEVRAHVRALTAAGMGYRRVAQAAGVGRGTLARILYGAEGRPPPPTTRYDLAQRLLAVELDLAPSALVDATGTVRRVRGLVAVGWTSTRIAVGIGWSVQNVCARLLCAGEPAALVTSATARAVADLYERWSMVAPDGPAAVRARRRAAARGWLPPLAWEDEALDDPAARPRVRRARPAVGAAS